MEWGSLHCSSMVEMHPHDGLADRGSSGSSPLLALEEKYTRLQTGMGPGSPTVPAFETRSEDSRNCVCQECKGCYHLCLAVHLDMVNDFLRWAWRRSGKTPRFTHHEEGMEFWRKRWNWKVLREVESSFKSDNCGPPPVCDGLSA